MQGSIAMRPAGWPIDRGGNEQHPYDANQLRNQRRPAMHSYAQAAEEVIMQLCHAWTDAIRDRDDAIMGC